MKKVHIDTNILIAAFMPEDIFFESSRKIYSKLVVDYEGYLYNTPLLFLISNDEHFLKLKKNNWQIVKPHSILFR